ncbi:hypothetical protein DCO58_02250 [Helicobacter saguini]|uniref:Uncharacterized protein n=1 Tax=Helicobacter saguini TaxID=1548018 RepID=A0A347VRR6_9HELI|nr:hypothetical protein [Helicobacter saguini]MWV62803.1 hypothetical protein [Helicobacter saguini]MWV66528.1 hypothetical protein [Helicobacter saguini]MWV68877.1 hypothetical protein [Helicobacter saguini]MWV71568.1 hypothetical protein [Helicobacter saguini]TLD93660.1 hypothetical protein LS64_008525 [Helicobacter saguini]
MDTQKFNHNIAIIESLNVSFYEKDLIRSAYYNHINNIPINKEANNILNKYFIVFRNGEIIFRNGNVARAFNKKQEIENRKKLYKQRTQQKENVYNKDFLQEKISPDTNSNLIEHTLKKADSIYNDGMGILNKCSEVLDSWLTKDELSYKTNISMIEQIKGNLASSIKALNEFLNPFTSFFDALDDSSKKEILQKADTFLQILQTEKTASTNLLIKLSELNAHNTKNKESISNDEIQNRINSLDAYKKNK